jgi:hypothetical protein
MGLVSRLAGWFPGSSAVIGSAGVHSRVKVAMVADDLTRTCFAYECQVIDLTPSNIEAALAQRPDLVFVESAWQGRRPKFRVAAYPTIPSAATRPARLF